MTTFSTFSQKFLGDCGILQLMDDLGKAVARDDMILLGGGNPSHIPAVQAYFRDAMTNVLERPYGFEALVGNYSGPAGDQAFIGALVTLFNTTYGWSLTPENVALTNGSQNAFFYLFNMFAGLYPDGRHRRILLPLAPEYIGYEDGGIQPDTFVAYRPTIELLPDRLFKYHIDFDALRVDDSIGAICVSRPTNPTGNVLTEEEIDHLSALAKEHAIPLIIDNAYGTPFPGILYADAAPRWDDHIVLCMSLSKLGLPGVRTGIVIAQPEIVRAVTGMNAVVNLAPGSFGSVLATDAVRTGDILRLSEDVIRPHYAAKAQHAAAWLREAIPDPRFRIHKPEGAFFLWLWFDDLPITSQELYARLMARGVVIVPGHYFFPGLDEAWPHRHQCIRMSYAGADEVVQQGIAIIAEEVLQAYAQVPASATT